MTDSHAASASSDESSPETPDIAELLTPQNPDDYTPEEFVAEKIHRWDAFTLAVPAEMATTRSLLVLIGVHMTEKGSAIPQGDLSTALMGAIAELEKRIVDLEKKISDAGL